MYDRRRRRALLVTVVLLLSVLLLSRLRVSFIKLIRLDSVFHAHPERQGNLEKMQMGIKTSTSTPTGPSSGLTCSIDDLLARIPTILEHIDDYPLLSMPHRSPESDRDISLLDQSRKTDSVKGFRLCKLLRGKTLLLLGSYITFDLHRLLLSELAPNNPFCPGAEYCTWHAICGSDAPHSHLHSHSQSAVSSSPPTSLLNPNPRLETSPARYAATDPNQHSSFDSENARFQPPPSRSSLARQGGALLRYVLSSTLLASPDRFDSRYTEPSISDDRDWTGIRIHESYWLAQARKAHAIVLNRGPSPPPSDVYPVDPRTKHLNTSFFVDAAAATAARFHLKCLSPANDHGHDHATRLKTSREIVVLAALDITLHTWLPSMFALLENLRREPAFRAKQLIWHSTPFKRALGVKSPSPKLSAGLLGLLYPKDHRATAKLGDELVLYHDAQVLFQTHLLTRLLPHFRVAFLILDADWNKGMGSKTSGGDLSVLERLADTLEG